ncbi:nuclear transport factor 2 family protein [Roseovarius sp. EL26]|uniref:nuclear transport factor 2 family protein n=1 Tax=Roseovarius sp. EL26 TaxID=2126672 RepID=UPI000EA1592E|nr:nuclear transport factor 2 family protein [Roseovarius sp. EL26]
MSNAIEIALNYIEASNRSDMEAITSMMNPSTTYSSQNTGLYLGDEQIMAMQAAFHADFVSLHWDISELQEIRPGVVQFAFTMSGTKQTGEQISVAGQETVIVYNNCLQHIEVKSITIPSEPNQ